MGVSVSLQSTVMQYAVAALVLSPAMLGIMRAVVVAPATTRRRHVARCVCPAQSHRTGRQRATEPVVVSSAMQGIIGQDHGACLRHLFTALEPAYPAVAAVLHMVITLLPCRGLGIVLTPVVIA